MSFLWYSMGWASSGAISTASLIFQIRAKTATALQDSACGAIRPTRQAVPPGGAAQPSTCPRRANNRSRLSAVKPGVTADMWGGGHIGAGERVASDGWRPDAARVSGIGASNVQPNRNGMDCEIPARF